MVIQFIVTVAVAAVGGFAAKKCKLPAPGLVGGMIFVTLLSVLTGYAYFPKDLRFYVRVAAGIYIGSGLRIKDIVALKEVKWGALVALAGMMLSSMALGLLIYFLTDLDFATSFLATAPGGTQEMTLIAAEVGGDPSKVASMQVLRVFAAVSCLPSIIQYVCNRKTGSHIDTSQSLQGGKGKERTKSEDTEHTSKWYYYILLVAVGLGCGKLFDLLGVPAGSMIGAMCGTVVLSVFHITPYIPRRMLFGVQCFSGAYIGSGISKTQIFELWKIIIPVMIMVVALILINVMLGLLMVRFSKVDIWTAMYSCAPGGLSEMVMIADDVGADPAKVTAMHVLRTILVVAIYPSLITRLMA